MGLTEIPEEIKELQHVTVLRKDRIQNTSLKLYLYANDLTRLPPYLFMLKNLSVLSLRKLGTPCKRATQFSTHLRCICSRQQQTRGAPTPDSLAAEPCGTVSGKQSSRMCDAKTKNSLFLPIIHTLCRNTCRLKSSLYPTSLPFRCVPTPSCRRPQMVPTSNNTFDPCLRSSRSPVARCS